jgi:hypothetical protein
VVAYHYCDYAEERTLLPRNIFKSLLHQIFRRVALDESVECIIFKTFEEGSRTPDPQELVDLIEVLSRKFDTVYILLDGIDECEKENKTEILHAINRLAACEEPCIKIIVSCRQEAQIVMALKQFPFILLSEVHQLEDIRSYVVGEVTSRQASGDLYIRNLQLEQLVVLTLVSKARGM